jgi:ABC-type polysaccharide/polyol phosphate transport system ATPase subunit
VGTTAVEVDSVSKRFRLFQEKYTSLKERVIHGGKIPYQDLWALNDISFHVGEGETIGILGRNGSGKSTLLKCICGVLQPTSGQVVVQGTLAGLLELGAGFQQELSGRDNIYLNGSLLGLSRKDIDKRFDDIVAFAELEQFIDNQVKFYSSGMYVRLGFAVAVNMDPDILVIDEVLAVGDERFQRKCMERVRQFQMEGRTIILVSHSPDDVRGICDRALVMDGGHMIGLGMPGEAVRVFREKLLEAGDALPAGITPGEADGVEPGSEMPAPAAASMGWPGELWTAKADGAGDSNRPVRLTDVTAHYIGEGERPYLRSGEPVRITVEFVAARPVDGVEFVLEVRHDQIGMLYRTDTRKMGVPFDVPSGPGRMEFSIDPFPFLDGVYEVTVGVQRHLGGLVYDWRESACRLEVMNPGREIGIVGLSVQAAMVPPVIESA